MKDHPEDWNPGEADPGYPPEDIIERRREDIKPYVERGLRCSMWGRDARDMDKEELVAFIGFLDELATMRQLKIKENFYGSRRV